jgi:DNA ligase-1
VTRIISPMLAATYGDPKVDKKYIGHIVFPVLVSPKIDGIRALVVDGVVQSRSGKPIPCPTIQELFGVPALEGLDGELAVGSLTASNLMQRTMGVMSKSELSAEDRHVLSFNIFDRWDEEENYAIRAAHAQRQVEDIHAHLRSFVEWVPHRFINSMDELLEYEAQQLALGYEGVMVNETCGRYKNGRCGKKEPFLIKVKRFTDDEAIVIGFSEMQHNDNEAFKSELGRTKRATLQENLRPAGVLGSLRLRAVTGKFAGAEFDCSGFTAQQRLDLWLQRDMLVGKLGTFKHFDVTGAKDRPRQPVWKGFRSMIDTGRAHLGMQRAA